VQGKLTVVLANFCLLADREERFEVTLPCGGSESIGVAFKTLASEEAGDIGNALSICWDSSDT
jgi:hypothetical protein